METIDLKRAKDLINIAFILGGASPNGEVIQALNQQLLEDAKLLKELLISGKSCEFYEILSSAYSEEGDFEISKVLKGLALSIAADEKAGASDQS